MQCHICDAPVEAGARFCPQCGAAQRQGFEAEPPEVPAGDPVEQAPRERFLSAAASRSGDQEPETEIWQGGYSPKAMIGAWVGSGVLTLVLLVVGIVMWQGPVWLAVVLSILLLWLFQLARLVYRRLEISYHLTTQRFLHEHGILKRVTDRIELIDIDDITFEQTVLERLVGVGTIRVTSSDRTHPELTLKGIDRVKEVATKLDDARRSERRRRGLHIESI